MDNAVFENGNINVVGDIFRVCPRTGLFGTTMLICHQMRKISVQSDDDLAACEEHARVIGSGVVSSTDRDRICFTIHGSQYVTSGDRPSDVVVRCRMDQNAKWNKPLQRLPVPGTVVAFEGVLLGFEIYNPPNTARVLQCAVLALDDITYIRRGGAVADSPEPKDSIRKKVRTRAQKFKNSSLANPAVTESTSESTLAPARISKKRRSDGSTDEVEFSVQPNGDD